jgi:hypothetical protein
MKANDIVEKISWKLEPSGLLAELIKEAQYPDDWTLYIDGFMHSSINENNRDILNFMCMDRIGRLIDKVLVSNPNGTAITLGAGALSIPGHIASLFPEVSQTVVELETNLVDKIIDILPIRTGKPIEFIYGDAKKVLINNLEAMTKKFDVVVVDIFLGKLSPDYLETLSFCNMLSQISSQTGVVLINFKDGEDLSDTIEFSKTLKESFMFVEIIKDNYFKEKNTGTDVLFIASNSTIIADLIKDGTGYETDTILKI